MFDRLARALNTKELLYMNFNQLVLNIKWKFLFGFF